MIFATFVTYVTSSHWVNDSNLTSLSFFREINRGHCIGNDWPGGAGASCTASGSAWEPGQLRRFGAADGRGAATTRQNHWYDMRRLGHCIAGIAMTWWLWQTVKPWHDGYGSGFLVLQWSVRIHSFTFVAMLPCCQPLKYSISDSSYRTQGVGWFDFSLCFFEFVRLECHSNAHDAMDWYQTGDCLHRRCKGSIATSATSDRPGADCMATVHTLCACCGHVHSIEPCFVEKLRFSHKQNTREVTPK